MILSVHFLWWARTQGDFPVQSRIMAAYSSTVFMRDEGCSLSFSLHPQMQFTFQRWLGNDDVIYEIIARNSGAFLRLENQMYVEYLMHVSSEYIISWVLLSLISIGCQTSRILFADVIPWINKASLMLYSMHAVCHAATNSDAKWRCWVCLLWLKLVVVVEIESRSETPSLRLRRRHRCGLDCVRTVLMTFYHMNH